MQWFVSRNGETVGLVPEAQVVEWVKQGMPGAFVRDESSPGWVPLEQSPFAPYIGQGVPRQPPPPVAPLPPTRRGPPSKWKTWAFIQLGSAATLCTAAFIDRLSKGQSKSSAGEQEAPKSPKPPHDKLTAWVMAQQFVKQSLKSPSSADFGGVFSGEAQSYEDTVTEIGEGEYRVRGWVDAQNAFGATVRSDFDVTVEYIGGGDWRVNSGPTLKPR